MLIFTCKKKIIKKKIIDFQERICPNFCARILEDASKWKLFLLSVSVREVCRLKKTTNIYYGFSSWIIYTLFQIHSLLIPSDTYNLDENIRVKRQKTRYSLCTGSTTWGFTYLEVLYFYGNSIRREYLCKKSNQLSSY